MNRTKIETAEFTWNPLTGCLQNCHERFGFRCYAETSARLHVRQFPTGFKPTWHQERLWEPTERVKPSLIMVCSVGELFGDGVPAWQIQRVLWVIRCASWHTFQLFTKNPGRLAEFNPLPPNAWVGVSVPAQSALDAALHGLRRVKAGVRFISFEPLMGHIALPEQGMASARCRVDWAIIGGLSGEKLHDRTIWSERQLHADMLSLQLARKGIPHWTKDNLALPTHPRQWPAGHWFSARRAKA